MSSHPKARIHKVYGSRVQVIGDRVKDFLDDGKSFVSTTTSGKADEEVTRERIETCRSCEFVNLRVDDGEERIYCNGCRCPNWRWAEMKTKAAWKKNSCPKGVWAR